MNYSDFRCAQVEQKSSEQWKLNRDCNMTVDLEAKLSLAVGALPHSINTETGLVNGAISTVLSVSVNYHSSV